MNNNIFIALFRRCGSLVIIVALGGCSALRPAATVSPAFYSLNMASGITAATGVPAARGPTLIVNPTHAAAGFDSQRILYVREEHKLEYFSHSEWVDPPARMLSPLLVTALANTGAFGAVALTPSSATGQLRLDTEIIRLQQEFGAPPSRAHFTLRAYLVDEKTRQVLAWREFDASVAAASEDPYGGVVAANAAVQSVLASVAAFCVEASRRLVFEK